MQEFQQILTLIEQSLFFKVLKLSAWAVLFISWVGTISYVSKDSERRYEKKKSQFLTILLPLFLPLLGFLIYFLVRPAQTKAERVYEKELLDLQKDLLTCPHCGAPIKEDFIFCPQCGKEIFDHCPNCGRLVKKDWQYCPYCRKKL